MNKVEECRIPGIEKTVSVYGINRPGNSDLYFARINGEIANLTKMKNSKIEVWEDIKDWLSLGRNFAGKEKSAKIWKGLLFITEKIDNYQTSQNKCGEEK